MDNMVELLARLKDLWETQNNEKQSQESEFNIFKTLGVENKEVIICRFIGELLNPDGSHGLETMPLKLFYDIVIGGASEQVSFNNTKIVLEDRIDENRRVDIAIKNVKGRNTQETYPIEVKIWAKDQPRQLVDYYHHYFNQEYSNKIYYLTPTGWLPKEDSRGDLPKECIKTICFRKEIKSWLESVCERIPQPQGFLKLVINQFLEVIDEMNAVEEYEKLLGLIENPSEEKSKPEEYYSQIQNAAFDFLRNSDELLKEIRRAHIKKYVKLPDEYKWDDDCTGANDAHALVAIRKNESIVAWICVDTNLYLCCKGKKEGSDLLEGKDNYFWNYISPNGIGKKFNMKEYPVKLDKDIDIGEILEKVEATNGAR